MTTLLKRVTLGNAVAFLALFICLGGTATAATKLINGRDIKRGTVGSEQIKDRSLLSRDIKDSTIEPADLSPTVRAQLSGAESAGNHAAAGAQGPAGQDGAQGPAGAPGAEGDTGAKGDTGAVGAPGAFVVKDADDTTAGTLLTLSTQELGTPTLAFYFKGHAFSANATTGALALPALSFYYSEPNCGGDPYYAPYFPAQTAVRSTQSPADIYEFGKVSNVDVQSTWQAANPFYGITAGCQANAFNRDLASMKAIPASDTPPALHGPLRFVPAG